MSLWTKCWERKHSNKLCISSFKLWRGSGGTGVLIPHSPSFLLWNVCCLHPLTCGGYGEYRSLNSRHSNVVWWHHLLLWIWKVFSDWLLRFQLENLLLLAERAKENIWRLNYCWQAKQDSLLLVIGWNITLQLAFLQ